MAKKGLANLRARQTQLSREIREQLDNDLEQDTRSLFHKVDTMIKKQRDASDIQEMMIKEIKKYMDKRMKQLGFLPT